MKKFLASTSLALFLALPAVAIDLPTNASVELIEGITLTQTTGLDFGVLVLNDGTVVISAVDGTYTDASHLVADATSISQGVFSVTSVAGVDVTVDCTAGAPPAGLLLGSFTVDWADAGAEGPVPHLRTMAADTEVLEIGASLTVDRTTATPSGGTPVQLPYTVAVTFQ